MKHWLKHQLKRRDFLKYLGVGLSGPAIKNIFTFKNKSVENLISLVEPPDGVIPGIPNWYASVCRQCSAGCGIHVKILEGRAKKIEGSPDFPVNYGKVCARGQAGLQTLYNPDRIDGPQLKEDGEFKKISWAEGLSIAAARLKHVKDNDEQSKIVFLTQPVRGTLGKLLSDFSEGLGADLNSYDFMSDDGLTKANQEAFGEDRFANYDIANAEYILSFGANFLDTWETPVKHSVGFGRMRDTTIGKAGDRGWLVHFEPRLSVTGASADEWFPIKAGTEGLLALAMAHEIVNEHLFDRSLDIDVKKWKNALEGYKPETVSKRTGVPKKKIKSVAHEFTTREHTLALCGGQATAQVDGTANAMAAN
ncbi:MAG: molybdopterin-dependent oxidoreductase, partial [Actinomycetia bacterium]|nr:molybdopterin-dependent oxidoreductase [Actinomycetes bacterium]